MKTIYNRNTLFRPTVAVINLAQLERNVALLKKSLAKADFFCPMVKANAYGHGDVGVVGKLRTIGVQHVGVGLIEEALGLRGAGDTGEILHFGMFDSRGAQTLLDFKITPVISSLEEISILNDVLKSAQSGLPFNVHLKVNTGMNRLGMTEEQFTRAVQLVLENPRLCLAGIATHLATGEELSLNGSTASEQLEIFEHCLTVARGLGAKNFVTHVANSATTRELYLLSERAGVRRTYGARLGISMYGVEIPTVMSPDTDVFGVRPILRLESEVVHIQNVPTGGRVSYGGVWQAQRPSKIGIVPIGYADGYHRGLSGADVLVSGRRAKIVGNICMDYLMVELTDFGSQVEIGAKVVLLGSMRGENSGDEITTIELAKRLNSVPYEILTSLSERVPRLYNDEPSQVV